MKVLTGTQGLGYDPATTSHTAAGDSGGGSGGGDSGGGGSGHSSGGSGGSVKIPSDAVQNDPWYQIQSAYINSSGQLDAASLQQMIGIANAKNALNVQGIQENLAQTQNNIMHDLANRQATESGDNAYYHGIASQAASNQIQASQLDLTDYLAGVQAAYAQRELQRQYELQNDMYTAFTNQAQYYLDTASGIPAVNPNSFSLPSQL